MKKVWSYLEENGHTGLELALGHNLSSPEMSTAICGMRNSKQLLEALKALKNLPSLEVLETVKKIIET
jgi:aryl-alcohol dehydrogenase-like predicted oxidoreductase